MDRKEIEEFIIDVCMDNSVYSAIKQMVKVMVSNVPLRRLEELYLNELYIELRGELYNIVLKGAYDSIKLLNEVTEEENWSFQKSLQMETVAFLCNINSCEMSGCLYL